MRHITFLSAIVLTIVAASAVARPIEDQTFPPSYVPSGQVLYKQFCAACHGMDAKGNGPAAATLTTPPPDLTTLTRRFAMKFQDDPEAGKFPYQYVTNILQFGPGPTAHGSADMPTWGPIFQLMDKSNERAVRQRIRNLCNYLASLQGK